MAQRADPKLAAIPVVVVMTGVADGAQVARALEAVHTYWRVGREGH